MRKPTWVATLVLIAIAAGIVVLSTPANASDDYPHRDRDPSELDSSGFYYRHCTSFVAWRLSRHGPFDNYMKGGHWYHARNWAKNAERLGFAVDSQPAVGAIAHWYPGEGDADGLGHVAIVESLNPDGTVFVEEYNGYEPYEYARRGPLRAARYIHIYDTSPARAVPAIVSTSGAAAPEPKVVDPGPVGHLTSPVPATKLRFGNRVSIRGAFTDDSGVAKVHFFAADERYRWRLVGTDAHGGNGEYSIDWKVDFPAGSVVSLYAEAFDVEGNPAVDSIRGLEGLRVVERASAAPMRLVEARSRGGALGGVVTFGLAAVLVLCFAWRRSAA